MKEKMEAKRKCEVYMAGLEQLSDHLEQQKKLEEQVQQQRAAFDVTRMAKRFYKKKYMEELRKKWKTDLSLLHVPSGKNGTSHIITHF